MVKFVLHFLFLVAGIAYLARRAERFYWRTLAVFMPGSPRTRSTGSCSSPRRRSPASTSTSRCSRRSPAARARSTSTARSRAQDVYRPNALTGDPNHLGIELIVPLLVLTPIYLRLERGHRLRLPLAVLLSFLLVVELATLSRSGLLGLGVGLARARVPYRRQLVSRALLLPLAAVGRRRCSSCWPARWDFFETVLRSRVDTSGDGTSTHFDVYDFIPDVLSLAPAVRARAEQLLGLLRVRHRPDELRAALVLRRAARRDRARRDAALRALPLVPVPRGSARLRALGRPARLAADAAARVGADRRARRDDRRERLLPDDVLLLLLRVRDARARRADRLRAPAWVKVVVLTTSYPRDADDVAGQLRPGRGRARPRRRRRGRGRLAGRGSATSGSPTGTASPATCAAGRGSCSRCRSSCLAFVRAARRASRDADLVHAHWLPSGLVAALDRQAVRRPALGHGRRARAPRPVARAADPAAGARRGRRVERARRRRARARCARGRADPDGRRAPAAIRRHRRAAARPLRRHGSRRRRGSRTSSRRPRGCRA